MLASTSWDLSQLVTHNVSKKPESRKRQQSSSDLQLSNLVGIDDTANAAQCSSSHARKRHKKRSAAQAELDHIAGRHDGSKRKLIKNLEFVHSASRQNEKLDQNARMNLGAHPHEHFSRASSHLDAFTPLQIAMQQKLASARFRQINELLYTSKSSEARRFFVQNPGSFEEYHLGFRQQVSSWPENPVDRFVQALHARGNIASKPISRTMDYPLSPLPRSNGVCVVADLGCGDAHLAAKMVDHAETLKIRVLSYDLQCSNKFVTCADISQLPLENEAVNVAIFCLALMSTNWTDFIEEAWRVLKWGGEIWISDIRSRFCPRDATQDPSFIDIEHASLPRHPVSDSGRESYAIKRSSAKTRNYSSNAPIAGFIDAMQSYGFITKGSDGIDTTNKMFVEMRFVKTLKPTHGRYATSSDQKQLPPSNTVTDSSVFETNPARIMKPCVYKRR